ncbi:hypothetical protein K457DRAFT_16066 [Linnemannia elongata AG-77]|uniref:Uncharacterized protein n=1 Tax=Linnemannia elongata AG-77 TaxID=1314771 RepID=A0A197K5P5_9FUNG|nr:hypothetical protein K457DRAFT_16066 [Linnemannia elongata AG-77]
MAPPAPSSSSAPESIPSPVAPLMTELYTFDTLLLTFLGKKSALPPTQPTTTITQTNPLDTSNGASNANAKADADAANAAAQMDQKTTPTSSSSFSPSIPSPPPTSPNLIDEALKVLLSKEVASSPSTGAISSSGDHSSSASSNPNLASWLELMSSPSISGSSSLSSPSSTSPSGSGKSSTNSDDFVGGKSTIMHGTSPTSTGGGVRGAGEVRGRGGITLAYQACQMLPEPIHLRHVNTTLLPLSINAPSSNGTIIAPSSNGEGIQDSYAIEYFADIGCTQFVMATAGTRVNVWQAELDLLESTPEKERGDKVVRYGSSRGGENGTARKRDNDDGVLRIVRRQSSPPSPSGIYTPWTPPPTTKQGLKSLDRVVSVRWVGIMRPTEFTLSKALIASRRPPNLNRLLVDPLLERRTDVNDNANDQQGNDGDGDNNNTDTPSSSETVTEIDERKDEGSDKGATGDGTSTPTTSVSLLVPPLQHGKDDGGDGVVGFVSWTPFNETTQLQAPTQRDTGSFPLDDMVFNLALRGKINSLNGTRNPTSTAAGSGGGHVGISHMTSQIVMAGLIAGLLLILGSLLTAIYYRQRRRKWYEEDGEV